jgi:hypothetical protein
MAGELDSLLVKLDADVSLLRRELARADGDVGKFERQVNAHLGKADKSFAAFGGNLRSILAGALTIGSIKALGDMVKGAIDLAGRLNDVAQSAGITATQLQQLQFAAEQSGIATDSFDSALLKFSKNMGELRSQTGPFYTFLKEFAPATLTAVAATTSQAEAFATVMDAINALDSAEQKLLVSQEAFGKSGAEVARMAQGGSVALAEFAAQAEAAGAVMSEELVAQGAAASDAFDAAARSLDVQFKSALIELGPAMATVLEGLTDLIRGARQLSADVKDLWDLAFPGGFGVGSMAVGSELPDVADGAPSGPVSFKGSIDDRPTGSVFPSSLLPAKPKGGADKASPWQVEVEDYKAAGAELRRLQEQRLAAEGRDLDVIRSRHDAELESFTALYEQKKITAEQFDAARQNIEALSAAQIAESMKASQAQLTEFAQSAADLISNTLSSAWSEMVETGKVDFEGLIQSALAGLSKLAAELLVIKPLMDGIMGGLSGGGGGDILGSLGGLFAGFFANGGQVSPGKVHAVGERGPELFVPQSAGHIIPNGAFGGGGQAININNHIDARGAAPGSEARLAAVLAAHSAATKREIMDALGRDARRYPGR